MPDSVAKYLNKAGLETYNDSLPHSPTKMQEYVNDWLDEHPEATTTVQDGSITGVKIADNAIPDAKLVQNGGVLERVSDIDSEVNSLSLSVDNIESILSSSTEEKNITDNQFKFATVEPFLVKSGSAVICNGNLLPSSALSASYLSPGYSTQAFEFNKWGFVLVAYDVMNTLFQAGKKYTVSYDFELLTTSEEIPNKEYGLMISGNVLPNNYKANAQNYHAGYKFRAVQTLTVPQSGFAANQGLCAYNGGNYNIDLVRISNLVVSIQNETPNWVESQRINVSSPHEYTFTSANVYVDSMSTNTSIDYTYIPLADFEQSVEEIIKNEIEPLKIKVNPIIKSICHRGLAKVAPEDTAPAYVAAKNMGYDYVENDLWFTSDGVPVMVHARDLSIVSDGSGYIDQVTYSYFKSLDFGQGETYNNKYLGLKGMSLEEFVVLCKQLGLKIYLDCNSFTPAPPDEDGIDVVISIFEKCGYDLKNVTWLLGISGVASVRAKLPSARVAYMLGSDITQSDIDVLRDYIISDNDATFFNVESDVITASGVQLAHEARLKVEAWRSDLNITDSKVIEIINKGIDGFTNDGVNITEIIDSYYNNIYGL